MIKLSFNGSDARVAAKLRVRSFRVVEALTHTLDDLMLELQRRIQRKLSGEVLQHASGRGLASVIKEPTVRDGNQIKGRVTAGAGPAFYLKIQERGGTRTYDILPVRAKALAFFPGGSLGGGGGIAQVRHDIIRSLYTRSGTNRGRIAPGKVGQFGDLGGVVVKKVVHPPLKARPFMKTSLDEMQSEIINRLRSSAANAVKA